MEVAVNRVLILLYLANFALQGGSKPALRNISDVNVSLPDHLDIRKLTTATLTFHILTGMKDPGVMVNKNQRPCAVFEDSRTTVQREEMLVCHCWLVEYNWDGTVAVARLPYAVTSGWTDGQTVDTGLLLIDAAVCSPLPCCSATLPRQKREGEDADEYYYTYEDVTDSEGLRAGSKKKVKKKKQTTKTKTSSGISTGAIIGIVIGIIAGVLVICGVILGYCYYLYKQEIARIRFRNRRIEQNNKRAAAARAARKA